MAVLSDASTDASADVMEQSTPLGKIAKKLLSQIHTTRAYLHAEMLKEKVNSRSSSEKVSNSSSTSENGQEINSSMKRLLSMSSSSSSGPKQQPQLKRLKAHISISDDDIETPPPCDFPCVACALAGARLIPDCCMMRGHSGPHECLGCMHRATALEGSPARTRALVKVKSDPGLSEAYGSGVIARGEV